MSWDPYLDVEHGVLRNRLGITDADELARVERRLSAQQIARLEVADVAVRFDLGHLRAT